MIESQNPAVSSHVERNLLAERGVAIGATVTAGDDATVVRQELAHGVDVRRRQEPRVADGIAAPSAQRSRGPARGRKLSHQASHRQTATITPSSCETGSRRANRTGSMFIRPWMVSCQARSIQNRRTGKISHSEAGVA